MLRSAITITPFVIRWGPDGWAEKLQQHGRCSNVGWQPFPVGRIAPVQQLG